MARRSALTPFLAALAAAALAGCGPSTPADGGSDRGTGFPQPGPPGSPIGDPSSEPVSPGGGAVASPDGYLFVDVPPGAVPAGALFTVQEVMNLAPGGIGPAWRIGPEGTTFPVPVTITIFAGGTGRPLDEITVAWQDEQGYWHRAVPSSVVRDPLARTLAVQTNHLSSWTLTTIPTARDFKGAFSVGTSLGAPFVATGDATFTFAGEDVDATYYLLSGTLVLPSAIGTTTCVPVAPDTSTFPLRTNVAELSKGTAPRFDWGASGAWHVSCADGTARLVTIAFDTVGVGFPGCTRVVTRAEVAGIDAALGGVTWDCASKGLGQTSGSWDYASAACGTACVPVNPCKTGTVTCGTGAATCTESGNVLDGATCGTDQVCSAGACVACTAGLDCTPANPCVVGVTSCATGTSACVESTTPATPLADGATCGADQVCSAGACVACTAGLACTPANPCHQGLTSCATGASVCGDTGFALTDGSFCGTDLVCYAGACIACTQGAPCTSANACTATATYECRTGAAVCTDRTSQPPGTACGTGLVCSAAGLCDACSEGAPCASANPCATAATTACGSGTPVCVDSAFLPTDTTCGSGLVCNASHQCVPITCTAGLACTPPNSCMNGTTSCPSASGSPVCVETTPVANGVSCGVNQVCNGGTCTTCNQDALCTSANPCTSVATIACGTGTPVCTDRSWLPAGAGCGPPADLYCSSAHVCASCTAGASCTPTSPCALSAAIQCSTGVPVCADQGLQAPGSPCGAGSVCTSSGTCTLCTQGTSCASTNPCAATATMECANGPVCTDRTFVADGTSCGSGLVCSTGSCVAARTVTGTRTVTYWPDAGPTAPAAPAGAASSSVAALVANGSSWATFTGSVTAAGAVSIPNVPTGSFWLRFQAPGDLAPTFLDTAGGTTLDLGYDQLGRSSVTRPSASTAATFALQVASTWPTNNADLIQLASSNADVWDRLTPPATLTTNRTRGNWTDNWFSSNATATPLNLLLNGDTVTIFHLVAGTISTRTYLAARSKFDRTDFAMSSGTPFAPSRTTLSATGLTSRTPATGTWDLVSFEALRPAMNLPATGIGPVHSLVVGASVGALTGNGPVPRNAPPTLFSLSVPVGATTSANLGLGTALTYARVLPARWSEWREISFAGSLSYVAPGASSGFTQSVSVGRREAAPATSALAPTLSPVRNLRVRLADGSEPAASAALSGIGTTPLLLWDAPITGSPTSYVVEIFRLGVNGTASTSTKVATFLTGATRAAIPGGVLTAGVAHYVRVTARAVASDPWATAPFRRVVLGAWAETLSGTLTP